MTRLNYNALRENDLTSVELHLLIIVSSYSKESHISLSEFARMMKASISTVKRVIVSLKQKGHINVRYGVYKSLHISISISSPMVLSKSSNDDVIKLKMHRNKAHPRAVQYRVNKELIESSKMLPQKFIPEEPNPEDFKMTPEDVTRLIKNKKA